MWHNGGAASTRSSTKAGTRSPARRRSWHPAGTDRAEAERLAAKLAAKENSRVDAVRSLTFGAYLTSQWLPAKKLHLATSTYRGYERNVAAAHPPHAGPDRLRRVRYQQIEALYDTLLHPAQGRGLAPKTVYEIHLIIRGSLDDAVRRGLVTRNVALVARAPKQRSLQRIEGQAWTEEELRLFLRTAAGHRHFPIMWLTAMTGMRRNEVLGLKWTDIDFEKKRLTSTAASSPSATKCTRPEARPRPPGAASTSTTPPSPCSPAGGRFQTAEFAAVGIDSERRVGLHRRRRRAGAPPRRPPELPADRAQRRRPPDPVPRPAGTPTAACSSRKASRSRSSANDSATPTSPTRSRPTSTSCPACRTTRRRPRAPRRARSDRTRSRSTVERRRNNRRKSRLIR